MLLCVSIITSIIIAVPNVHASPDELHVGPGEDYSTIQDAVDAADLGDTVLVHDGTYVENVNIDESITLKAASTPVIDGNKAGPCITIAADSVTVDGFELMNGTYGVASWGTDNSVISNNIIHDNLNVPGYAGCGILFWSDSDDFDNNIISGNVIYNNDRQGIYIGGTTSSYISEGNTISRNTIYNNGLNTTGMGPDASITEFNFRTPMIIQSSTTRFLDTTIGSLMEGQHLTSHKAYISSIQTIIILRATISMTITTV